MAIGPQNAHARISSASRTVLETVQIGASSFGWRQSHRPASMFAWMRLEQNDSRTRVISYRGQEALRRTPRDRRIFPAPYVARIFW